VDLRIGVGRLLAAREKPRRGELGLFAEVLEVTPRTLRKWRDQAERSPVMGRPPLAGEAWRAAVVPVARAWQSQGWSAGRPRVLDALEQAGIEIPVSIVRALLKELKARRRRYLARKRATLQKHVRVNARDALCTTDASHLGRDGQGKVEALAVKDAATTTVITLSIGGAASGADLVALLQRAKRVRGRLPLVLGMDNGPANQNALVRAYLAAERVIVLWNVPHTPQHNAPIESYFGELKIELEASDELVAPVPDPSETPVCSSEAGVSSTRAHFQRCVPRLARKLNEQRVRTSRGGFTAAQLDRILPHAEDLVSRDRFYDTACAAIESAVQGIENARARRRAEREAILCTLEQFGLVTRTRGRRPAACSKAERLS
jgi:transposase InsO family protein